jgi:hypothetical protein
MKGKCKVIPVQVVEALRVARGWGSQMAARLSALCAGRFLPPGRFLVLILLRGWVDPRAIVRLEGLGQLKKSTSSGTRTGDLPACIIVPQPTTLPRAPRSDMMLVYYIFRYDTSQDIWGSGGTTRIFLTSALYGGEWSASRSCRFIPWERAHSIHWIECCLDPWVSLDAMKRKIL